MIAPEDFDRMDEAELARLAAIAHLMDSPSLDPLFDEPLQDEDVVAMGGPFGRRPQATSPASKPARREATRHG